MKTTPKIIITIPAYNEEKTLGKVLEDIKKEMKKTGYNYKIQVVDDGSTDKTPEIARNSGAIVFSHPRNFGLAETFRTEVKKALEGKYDIIVHTDADGQYLAKEIPSLIKPLENGEADLVLGSRFAGTIEEMPFMKRWGNKQFSKVISKITGQKITDGQTGFRAFTREVAENVKIISNHTYTQEMIIKAIKERFRVKEVPVYFAKRGGDGESRLMKGPFRYATRAWINMLRVYRDYEPLKFFGTIGSLFILVGFILGIWLTSLFIMYGEIGRLPSLILTMLLIVTGVQILLFGFLADMKR